jgi:predicted RNA binding protein YcfA (HicA-like mRNA interferase family)
VIRPRIARALRRLANLLDPVKAAQTVTIRVDVDADEATEKLAALRASAAALGETVAELNAKIPTLSAAKGNQIEHALARLQAAGFVVRRNAGGTHLQVRHDQLGLVDYWPTTGKWWIASRKLRGTGLDALLDALLAEVKAS